MSDREPLAGNSAGPGSPSGPPSWTSARRSTPLSLGLALLAILPLVALAFLIYGLERDHAHDSIRSQLQELASVREAWVETHLGGLRTRTALVQSQTRLRRLLRDLQDAQDPAIPSEIGEILADAVAADPGLIGAEVSDRDGATVAEVGRTSGASTPGVPPDSVTFDRLDSLPSPPGIAEVMKAPLTLDGTSLGALRLWFSGRELLALATDSMGLGSTGEALLGFQDDRGTLRFIGPVRFGSATPLAPVRAESRLPLQEAIDGAESFLTGYSDYRDVPVLSAVRHVDPVGWGLVVKMDRSEALAPLTRLRRSLVAGTGGIGVVLLLVTLFVARRLRHDEEELVTANARLRDILVASPFPAMVHAEDGEILLISDSWTQRTGYRQEELRCIEDWTRKAYGEAAGDVRAFIDTLYDASDPVEDGIFHVRARSGEELVWSFRSMALGPLEDGRRTVLSMAVDVTERTRLMNDLQRTLDHLHATLRSLPLPFWELDREGRVTFANPAVEEVFGWTLEEARGRVLPIVPDEADEEFQGHMARVLDGARLTGVETVRRTRSGREIPVLVHADAVRDLEGRFQGIVVIYEDLTEEKKQERELRRLNRALTFVSASNAALVRSRLDTELVDQVCRVAIEKGSYAHVWIAFRLDDSDRLQLVQRARDGEDVDLLDMSGLGSEIEAASSAGVALVNRNLTVGDASWERRLADQGYRTLAVVPFPEDVGADGYIALSHEEPESLDEAEVAILRELAADLAYGLRVSAVERRLFLIGKAVESLSVGVSILDATDSDFPLRFVNRGFTETTGYEAEEVMGRYCGLLQGPDSDPEVVAEIESALEEGRSTQVTVLNYKSSGEPFWNRLTLEPVTDDGGAVTHFVAIQEDVTDQRRVGKELEHRARLSAVGELAGGVAHDFRNILTASEGLLRIALADADLGPDARDHLAELENLVSRGAAVTERLLALSRRGSQKAEPTALVHVLQEAASLISHTLRDDIVFEVDAETGETPVAVELDKDQFTTVLLNLVRNAAQAMPEGGQLTLACDYPVAPGEPSWWPADLDADGEPWVRIRIRDTGVGMDAETLAHAFDPYFTTKPSGEGTGLGLPAVYGAIERMGGRVWLDSTPGRGTTAHILLPTLDPETVPSLETATDGGVQPRSSDGRTGTILLAEDDASVMRVFRHALERAGHTVLAGKDGAEALDAYRAHGGPVDLVVTDGVMPRMSGGDLATALWQTQPGLPVIVTSGFGSEDIRQDFPDEPPGPLVFRPKPLSLETLLESVNEYLPRRSTPA